MGLLKNLIREYEREVGGKGKAIISANKWFVKAKKDSKEQTLVKTNERFKRGKIYIFRYNDPLTKERLSQWDANPVVLGLGQDDYGNDIGINFNYLPNPIRLKIMDKIMEEYSPRIEGAMRGKNKENAKAQQQITSLNYINLGKVLIKVGYKQAIRTYKPKLKTDQFVLSYEAWARLTYLNLKEMRSGGKE
jgi:hypothetical protein